MTGLQRTLTFGGALLALLAQVNLGSAQTPSPTLYTLHNFRGNGDGAYPNGIIGGNGVIIGTTQGGGVNSFGTVFSMTVPTSAGNSPETIIYGGFTGGSSGGGGGPEAGVTRGSGGVLYGTNGAGVFSLTPPSSPGGAWTESQLYTFTGGLDGGEPYISGVVIGSGGVLYGTTVRGGAFGMGVVYSLTPPSTEGGTWTEDVLFNFPFNPNPSTLAAGGVVIGSGGVLYGVAFQFGTSEGGVVYSLTPPAIEGGAWTEETLFTFPPNIDNVSGPIGGLTIGSGGVLYGTTIAGGQFGGGTVFALTPPASPGGTWTEHVLYSFSGENGVTGDGESPETKLAFGPAGVLYGTTVGGGTAPGYGIVFSLTPPASPGGNWTETILHAFTGNDGSDPGAVIVGEGGVLYGTTAYGGAGGLGTVFGLTL